MVNMTGRGLLSRCAWLILGLIFAGALHLTLRLLASDIATQFAQAYVPLTKEEAFKLAVNSCDGSIIRRYQENCSVPNGSTVSVEMERHKAEYDYRKFSPVKERVQDVTDFALGMVYAALALAAIWAFVSWFTTNVWPMLAGVIGSVRNSLDLSEKSTAWRLRRAEEEFRTLKSLRDDGLIAEEVFAARKGKLKAAIKGNPVRNRDH